ncbi:MAG: hypothetical protein ACM32O_07305 [Clostridia bacterium]
MDLDTILRQEGQAKRAMFQPDKPVRNKMESQIREGIQQKRTFIKRGKMAWTAALLLVMFTVSAGYRDGVQILWAALFGSNGQEELKQKLITEESFVPLFEAYTGWEINKIGRSPYADVFQTSDTSYRLETEKGVLHVVFFPNAGEAEKVEIDEDFSVSGKITFTFTGANVKKAMSPFHANGPTYLCASNNVLMISDKLSMIQKLRVMVYLLTGYQDAFQTFSIDPSQYEYWTWETKLKEDSVVTESAFEEIKMIEMEQVTKDLKEGDAMPGIFIRKDGNEALFVNKAADGMNRLYRYERKHQSWVFKEHVNKPGKIVPPLQ